MTLPAATAQQTQVAAGAVVHRTAGGERQYLLVHRPRYDDWSLPKGKLDPGETEEEAAAREVAEETGWSGDLGPAIGSVAYAVAGDVHKIVRYWLMEGTGGAFAPSDEVDEITWLPFDDAVTLLSYPRDQAVLRRGADLAARPARAAIHLVRHAYAGRKKTWDGDDRVRPVQGRGWREVAAITDTLSTLPVTRVISSPYLRCVQSVAALAASLDLPIEEDTRLAEDGRSGTIDDVLAELAGEAAAVCTHGEIVAALMGRAAAEGARLDGGLVWEKGSIWLLEADGSRVVGGRYLPAPTS